MDIGQHYIDHGSIDVTSLRDAVLACPAALGEADEGLRKHLAKNRTTKSLFLLRIGSQEIYDTIRHRPRRQKDVAKQSTWRLLHTQIAPILNKISELYLPGGVFVSVQIACLPAHVKIHKHTDSAQLLTNSHRLHVPLVTNDDVHFEIDDRRVILESNRLYEINNKWEHGVENRSNHARIHLIIDYLPADRNDKQYFDLSGLKNSIAKTARPYERKSLQQIVATSVVRGAHQKESHGGIYLVDMKTSSVEQKYDWNLGDIDFQGRGWDRGLRGIAFNEDEIYIAASDELFLFNKNFEILDSFKNPYLKHAHELCVFNGKLYVTSTGYDSILRFDLHQKTFDHGLLIRRTENKEIFVNTYDPNGHAGPEFKNTIHLNQVFLNDEGLFLSGRGLPCLMQVDDSGTSKVSQLPRGTHNARPYGKGILLNDTESDRILYFSQHQFTELFVPAYPEGDLLNAQFLDEKLARQSFGRGLCESDGIVYAGSSPSTISAYDLSAKIRVKSVNISMDVRNAIHGLAVWPY